MKLLLSTWGVSLYRTGLDYYEHLTGFILLGRTLLITCTYHPPHHPSSASSLCFLYLQFILQQSPLWTFLFSLSLNLLFSLGMFSTSLTLHLCLMWGQLSVTALPQTRKGTLMPTEPLCTCHCTVNCSVPVCLFVCLSPEQGLDCFMSADPESSIY